MTAPTLAAIRREMADDLAACAAALRGTDPLYHVRVRVHRVYLRLLDIDYLTEGAGAPQDQP